MVEKRQPTEGCWEENMRSLYCTCLPGTRGTLNKTMDEHRAKHVI